MSYKDICRRKPAFPHVHGAVGGMTLRDYFAAQALIALTPLIWGKPGFCGEYDIISREAYRVADSMMEQRDLDEEESDPETWQYGRNGEIHKP